MRYLVTQNFSKNYFTCSGYTYSHPFKRWLNKLILTTSCDCVTLFCRTGASICTTVDIVKSGIVGYNLGQCSHWDTLIKIKTTIWLKTSLNLKSSLDIARMFLIECQLPVNWHEDHSWKRAHYKLNLIVSFKRSDFSIVT